jgi:hypothetical protein
MRGFFVKCLIRVIKSLTSNNFTSELNSMTEPIFFEIPIYRCTLASHSTFMDAEEQKVAPIENKEKFPVSYTSAYNYFHKEKWYSWKYNEIVGYLNLYIMGSQFRGDIWFICNQRINKGIIKKKFRLLGKTFEKEIPRLRSSTEIFEFIIETLIQHNKSEYKKYHFDLKTFKVIGQFVDWVELTKKLNSYTYPEHRKKYFEEG